MKLNKFARALLKNSAPTLLAALALPPPFNLIASSVVSGALQEYLPTPKPDAAERDAPKPAPKVDPAVIEKAIQANSEDPDFTYALRQAEIDLQRYEVESGLRFREIELEDRKRATELHTETGIGPLAFKSGMRLVYTALVGLLFLILGLVYAIFLGEPVPPEKSDLTIAAFGLIGTAVGFVNGVASNVVSFYWGSSQGSKDKSDALTENMREFGTQMAKVSAQAQAQVDAARALPPAAAPLPVAPPTAGPQGPAVSAKAATPAGFEIDDVLPALTQPHAQFAGSVVWNLVTDGISVDGAPAARTNGAPETARRIWDQYGRHCQNWARSYGVPVELIVATIATETKGDRTARRFEKHLNESSVGLMQTLVSTANFALGRSSIKADDLTDPSLSIEAGTAYIALQRNETNFDPPLVAAAYNAGSIRKDDAPANKWRLHCYPKGTGHHVTRFAEWFGDAMRVSAADDWSDGGTVPSFAAALADGPVKQVGAGQGQAGLDSPLLRGWTGQLDLAELKSHPALTKEIQQALTHHGYLDPPPDGQFGPVSAWALGAHCGLCDVNLDDGFSAAVANSLLLPLAELPDWPDEGHWFDRVIAYMRAQGFWYCRVPEAKTIVYLEGVDADGTVNPDKPNKFNDLRCVFWLDAGGASHLETWDATTEPGRHYTINPVNTKGAARIKFGQYKAWRVGMHRNDHEALRQVMPIPVHRDLNQDFIRTGDAVDVGQHFINQHWGYDFDRDDIQTASAGCLVGRTKEGHREFMELIKTDPRYLARSNYTFMTTILPGDEVLG